MGVEDFDMQAAVTEIGNDLGFGSNDSGADGSDNDLPDADSGAAGGEQGQSGAGTGGAGGAEASGGGAPASSPSPAPTGDAESTDGLPVAPPPPDINTPPKTWRKEAAEGWAQLPEHIRAEVHKREQDMYAGLDALRGPATFGKEIDQICQPYKQVMDHFGVTPQQIIPGLLNAHATLTIGSEEAKVNTFASLVESYRIPLPALLSKLLGVDAASLAPAEDPSVKSLREELTQVKSQLTATQQRDLETRRQQVAKEIAEFAADPKHAYFDELADDIAQLMSSGVCRDLKSAYDKALWANPATRAKEMQRLDQERTAQQEKERLERLKKAGRSASVSPQATPKPGVPTEPKGSLDETLNNAYAAIMARG